MHRPALAAAFLVAALAAPDAQQITVRKPVSFALVQDYRHGEDLGAVEADFRLMQMLEVRTWRGAIAWDQVEPAAGGFNLDWLHRFAELAARHDIQLRPYVAFTPQWAAQPGGTDALAGNNPPARLEQWGQFVGALAAGLARHSNVRSYEIYNGLGMPGAGAPPSSSAATAGVPGGTLAAESPESAAAPRLPGSAPATGWDGTPIEYARTAIAASRAIRSRHPGADVLFGGMRSPDAAWIEAVCSVSGAPGAAGILSLQAYPESDHSGASPVEQYLARTDTFIAAADRRCGRKRIWISEVGRSVGPALSDRDQAYWWVRAIATLLAHPRIEHIGIATLRDHAPASLDAGGEGHHSGLVQSDRTPRMAFSTIDLLSDLLDTGTIDIASGALRVTIASGTPGALRHHLFTRRDGDRVLFIWDQSAAPVVQAAIPGVRASVEYDPDGRALQWDPAASVLNRIALQPGVPRIFRLMR